MTDTGFLEPVLEGWGCWGHRGLKVYQREGGVAFKQRRKSINRRWCRTEAETFLLSDICWEPAWSSSQLWSELNLPNVSSALHACSAGNWPVWGWTGSWAWGSMLSSGFSVSQTVPKPHLHLPISVQISHSVMSNSATPWTAAGQASWSITNSQSLLKLTSIESVMPSTHLILCCPLLLLLSVLASIKVFSNESVLCYQVAKVLELQLQHQSIQWIFRTYFL